MRRLIVLVVLLSLGWGETNAQSATSGQSVKFMGRDVTIIKPELDPDGFSSKAPASVCLEAPPQRQCYTAPKDFDRAPTLEVVQLDKDTPELFFSVASGGVSGFEIHFALLRPGQGKDLENLFALTSDPSVSNISGHAFWNDATISEALIFVTADYVWGPDEAHYSDHRFIASAYVQRLTYDADGSYYFLADRYMTVGMYSPEDPHILDAEKPEILARLRRVKAEMERESKAR